MKLNFKQYGQGDPLIILHGLLGSLDNWHSLARKFAENFTVFTIDQRNHGRSPHSDIMDYPTLAQDIAEFMEENWIYNSNIIGHSMGGKVAIQLALDFPDLLKKLVVVDISPKKYLGNHEALFDAMLGLDLDILKNRTEVDNQLKTSIPNDSIRLFLLKNLTRKKSGGYRWKSNLDSIIKNYQNILASIDGDIPTDVPALFIKGALSNYINSNDRVLITSYFTNSKIETIIDTGHWVHAEKPNDLYDLVIDFL